MIRIVSLLILLITLKPFSWAQEVYPLDTLYPVHALDSFLYVFPDTNAVFTPEQILKDSTSDYLLVRNFPRYLDINTVYWARLNIKANAELKDWKLHLQDRYFGDLAWVKGNGKVDVYAYKDEDLLFHHKSGSAYTRSEKEIPELYNLNRVPIPLPANDLITLLIRVEGNSGGMPPFFNVHFRKDGYDYYHPYSEARTFFNTFLLGVFFIVFVYHLLQFIYLRQAIFFWFSLWLLIPMLTQAMVATYTSDFLLGNIPNARFPVWNFVSNGILFTFWFFGRSFINSKTKFPKIDKAILTLTALIGLEVVINTCYLIFWDPPVFIGAMGIHYEMVAFFSIAGLALAIIIALQKDRFAIYFGIAAIIATSFTLIGSLWSLRLIRLYFDPYGLGLFLQVIAYSFGIAYRQQQLNLASQQEKLAAEKSRAEAQRIKDLNEVKTRFFANISHEFRTPLSLISGLIQRAFKKVQVNPAYQQHVAIPISQNDFQVIKKNANRLEHLVDQLLDLSKIESGHVHLNLDKGALVKFIKSIVFSFESMAERQNISLNTNFPNELEFAYYDKDKLEKIITNLLSNAFKFTPSGGVVTFSMQYDSNHFIIKISDTGKGISKENIHKIFERFYRVEGSEEKGSGIGLALTKELVDLQNGQVSVSSTKGQGTTFKVRIPYILQGLPENISFRSEEVHIPEYESKIDTKTSTPPHSLPQSISAPSDAKQDLPSVLLVEDNADLRQFIKDILRDSFTVLTANDGEQGERMAFEHIPDIIISDVMMPKKDGYELSHSLKTNTKTSHIPIIMLTAKAGQSNKMEGLTQGVDAYLTKPFDGDELLLRMRNLIENRRKIWEQFESSDLTLITNLEITSVDDQFLQNVVREIKENLDNERLSVEDIARAVGFSRSQLHRKLKALTNQSTNQLILDIRLNEARRMLEAKQGSVSEVAYSVGYSNMSYFTRSFKSKFGVLPSRI